MKPLWKSLSVPTASAGVGTVDKVEGGRIKLVKYR